MAISGRETDRYCAKPSVSSQMYQTFFELMNEGGLTLDSMGRIHHCNPCFAMMMREPIDSLRGRCFYERLSSAGRDRVRRALDLGRADAFEGILYTMVGDELPVLLSLAPVDAIDQRMTCVAVTDLSEQRSVVDSLRRSEEFGRGILNSMNDGIIVLDASGTIIAENDSWRRYVLESSDRGRETGEAFRIGSDYILICEELARKSYPGAREVCDGIKSVLAGELPAYMFEYPGHTMRGDRWFILNVMPLGAGHRGVVISHCDISRRKKAEDEIRMALQEKSILLRELYHRTKNNMAMIIAMLDMQSSGFEDAGMRDAFLEAEDRIMSMALVQELLYDSENLSRINLRDYIGELIDHLMESYQAVASNVRTCLELNDVFLPVEIAIPCGMILNELISNALKYAFDRVGTGTIKVVLSRGEDSRIGLVVSDDGKGVPAGFDFRRDGGLGLQTIFLLGEGQLHGSVEFLSRGGVECRFEFSDAYERSGRFEG